MLLKKSLVYKQYELNFKRFDNLPVDVSAWFMGCVGCSLLINGACELKYERNIQINDLKCGFDIYFGTPIKSYHYVNHRYIVV